MHASVLNMSSHDKAFFLPNRSIVFHTSKIEGCDMLQWVTEVHDGSYPEGWASLTLP